MGTSKSYSPGTGGAWSDVKGQITSRLSGSRDVPIRGLVGDSVRAAGGVGVGGRTRGARSRGGTGGGGGGGAARAIGPVVGGLGGFGLAVRDKGLAEGLNQLGLQELVGKSAVEVVATIAEQLAATVDGLDGDLMKTALREAILDASALGDRDGFQDMEKGLQSFLNENGVAGLVELFLCRFVFDAVWINFEAYVQSKSSDENAYVAFMDAVESVCESEVRGTIDELRNNGEFESLDWFGEGGQQIGRSIFETIDTRLRAMGGE